MRNPYLATIERRHEARLRCLPRLGFAIPDRPTDFLLDQARAAFDIARAAQRKKTEAALAFVAPEDRDLMRYVLAHPISGGSPRVSYMAYNSSLATTAAPVKQPTGSAIRTMMQLKCATGSFGTLFEWGCSFDGSAAGTPGQVELVETGTVGATGLSTAYAVADIQPFQDPNSAPNTAGNAGGTTGVPFNLSSSGTSSSGFATGAVTEGSVTATRMLDYQLIAPTSQYIKQFPLGREPGYGSYAAGSAAAQNYLRCRMTFAVSVFAAIYILTEF